MISRRFGGLVGDYIQGWLLHSRETNPLIGALGSAVTIAGAGRVAELADAQDSGSCPGNRVEVQVLSRPRLRSLAVTYDVHVGKVLSKEQLEAAHCWEADDRVPQRPEMTEFRRQLRYHQSQWREAQGHPIGSQPIAPKSGGGAVRLVGSRLPLAYRKRLPVGEIKIDKSVVTHTATDSDDATIVAATIGLGHLLGLGLSSVTERVEDARTWRTLACTSWPMRKETSRAQ